MRGNTRHVWTATSRITSAGVTDQTVEQSWILSKRNDTGFLEAPMATNQFHVSGRRPRSEVRGRRTRKASHQRLTRTLRNGRGLGWNKIYRIDSGLGLQRTQSSSVNAGIHSKSAGTICTSTTQETSAPTTSAYRANIRCHYTVRQSRGFIAIVTSN